MNLFGVMDVSASALKAERVRAEVVASNMANAETTRIPEGGPYQRHHVVFESEGGSSSFGHSLMRQMNGGAFGGGFNEGLTGGLTSSPQMKPPVMERILEGARSLMNSQPGLMRTSGANLGTVLGKEQERMLPPEPDWRPEEEEAMTSLPVMTRAQRQQQGIFEHVSEHIRRDPAQSTRLIEGWIGSSEEGK